VGPLGTRRNRRPRRRPRGRSRWRRHSSPLLRALRIGGAIAQVGVLSGATDPTPFPISTILHKQVHLRGIYVGSRQDFEDLNKAITLAVLRPVGENFHWSQAARPWQEWKKAPTSASLSSLSTSVLSRSSYQQIICHPEQPDLPLQVTPGMNSVPDLPQKPRARSCAFFLAQGRETSALNQPCS